MARLFIERHARPKNRSWKKTARLLGLTPHPHRAEVLLDTKRGLAERWAERQIETITRRDVIELMDETTDRAPIVANRTLAALRKLGN